MSLNEVMGRAVAGLLYVRRELPLARLTGDLSSQALMATARQQMLASLDADADGALSASELAKLGNSDPAATAGSAATLLGVADRNGDGKLVLQELSQSRLFDMASLDTLLKVQAGAADGPSRLGEWLLQRADQDGDGLLSSAEYVQVAAPNSAQISRLIAVSASGARPTEAERAAAVVQTREQSAAKDFARLDTDGDGSLSAAELLAKLNPGQLAQSGGDIGKAAADLVTRQDGDGNGALSVDELDRALGVLPYPGFTAASVMQAVDADGDGAVTHEEIRAAIERRPSLYNGDFREPRNVEPGEYLLARLLRSTVDRLTDDFVRSGPQADVRI